MSASIGREREQKGRPRSNSNAYYTHLKSIVTIARKHYVDPKRLVDAFVEAWENTIAQCGRLMISRRGVTHDSATFLITKDEQVIWQFPITLESLRNPDILQKDIQDIRLPQPLEQERYQKKLQIDNLRFGMRGIDVKAKIVEILPSKLATTQWGSEYYVANVVIADETGSIRLSLWNNQIDMVHVGDEVELKNCYVSRFVGQPQLRLQRKSTMSIIKQPQREAC